MNKYILVSTEVNRTPIPLCAKNAYEWKKGLKYIYDSKYPWMYSISKMVMNEHKKKEKEEGPQVITESWGGGGWVKVIGCSSVRWGGGKLGNLKP